MQMAKTAPRRLAELLNALRFYLESSSFEEVTYRPRTSGGRFVGASIDVGISVKEMLAGTQYDTSKKIARVVLHELGHFFVAPKTRRRKKDYGIPRWASSPYWHLDEAKACIVEHYLGQQLGFRARLYFSGVPRSSINAAKAWWKSSDADSVRRELVAYLEEIGAKKRTVRRRAA